MRLECFDISVHNADCTKMAIDDYEAFMPLVVNELCLCHWEIEPRRPQDLIYHKVFIAEVTERSGISKVDGSQWYDYSVRVIIYGS